MPVSRYFGGKGEEVMESLRKKHPKWDEKKLQSVFYATATKYGAKPGQTLETKESESKSATVINGDSRLDTAEG